MTTRKSSEPHPPAFRATSPRAAWTPTKDGRVLSGVNAEAIRQAHYHGAMIVAHLAKVMEDAGVDPLDAGNLDNLTNPLDAEDPAGDGQGLNADEVRSVARRSVAAALAAVRGKQ